jgi:hypothetical protein
MKRIFFNCLLFVALGLSCAAEDRTLLLVDDHDVLYRSGTRRFMEQPVRHARNPLITEDKAWEMAIGWTSVHRDEKTGKYQLWYQAYAGTRAKVKTHECVVCYAESDDGIVFSKPNLGLFDFNGEKDTNIVLLGSGGYGDRYCNSVLFDVREKDAAKRYKMALNDWTQDEKGEAAAGLHVAYSPDGIHWTKAKGAPFYRNSFGGKGQQEPFAGENPYTETKLPDGRVRRQSLMPLTLSDAADVIYDPKHEAYVIFGKMWLCGPDGGHAWKHGMGRSESKDFLHWSKPEFVYVPDDEDGELEFHTSPVFIHRERYFSVNQILNRAEHGMMDIELMVSRDGFEWERPFRKTLFLPRSPGQEFDSGTLLTNCNMIVHGDEMRFYYGAYSSGAIGGGTDITGDQQKSGVGLVTLPLDRFAGVWSHPAAPSAKVKKPTDVGQITLKPLDLAGRTEIFVNANAKGGVVLAELLDADGYRMPGYDKASCVPVKADGLRQKIEWKNKKLAELAAGKYHIRLQLQKACVYAVTLR